ncbi:suppressor of fused domain protein [Saccharopolyspora terrae]|uniref:Suppressor of fused domain protein n=1 Tax=Saccharopolyspora terrae TaxID=2530384 RepID=A0A4R4VG55_9PSEU|nr:suppressor of fused domain protein [Saccharopolyspora terrae]TDD04589.1 suppressor of fused domain protein [Saccharopolyspora terrae]
MGTPTGSSGVLGHLEHHLGPVQRVESAQSDQGNRGYDLTSFHRDEPPISTIVTNGLRFQTITSMLPEELACSLWDGQENVAQYLVDSTASMILKNGRGLEYGMVIENRQPIVNGTEIQAVLAHQSPFFGGSFDVFPDNNQPELQIISLIPITSGEAGVVHSEGPSALFERFKENQANILDVRRPAVA